ncbi:HAD domain-containing protein [Kitasatospora sp. NPDC086009]|uniref:HAD domain-containing protein n=1 Tax=unclassified Kitasatospora TaxID=2633591 RepID=UPI002E34CE82|nr:HAD domain-containing protein [Kitasatospora sp. NBC_01246]
MPKPLLFLDVDGVLNPVCPRPEAGFDAHTLLGYSVLLSARHGEWLRELADTYELVWATTWEEEANTHIAPAIGLPRLPVVRFAGYVPQPGDPRVPLMELFSAHKWAPLLRYAAGRPFAWTDDVIPPRLVRNAIWRRDRLLLPIDPGQGLERRHVDRLLARPPRPLAVRPAVSRWAAS